MKTRGSVTQRKFRESLVGFLERYTIHFYVIATILYLLMIPLSIWVFPSTTMLLTVIVLFSGFVSSVASLASTLIDLKQNDDIDELSEDIDDLEDDGLDNDSIRRS